MAIHAPARRYRDPVDDGGQRPQRARAILVGAGVALVAFLLGVATTHVRSPLAAPNTPVAAPHRLTTDGVAVGWPRTKEGAVGAASAWLLSPESDTADLRPVIEPLGWTPGARLLAKAVPVMYRVEDYTPDRAVVDVYAVDVLAIDPSTKVATLGAAWGLQRQTLTWAGSDWKLQDVTTLPAPPVPAVLNQAFPTQAGAAISALDGFRPFVPTAARP